METTDESARKGRWNEPYAARDGTWRCVLRHPLTYAQEQAGLLYVVVAADRDGVIALMRHEDEKARRTNVPAHIHRNSG
ncbi:hypothetical protein BTM25_05450 [Actinomadura rubteroloni]|uniref:Uncharacterized protein n=1 Tax=Actinomadura rubteroloni TaxID=1926885 RepID=A0A2P4UM85_9ACTN|nr:hypothetical protein [Actinomadura rubteroloni]POM26156.1 hypothetical protein BTM25_05450 [Actinomadura rubteroloni]